MDPIIDALATMRTAGVPSDLRQIAIQMAKDAARIHETVTVNVPDEPNEVVQQAVRLLTEGGI